MNSNYELLMKKACLISKLTEQTQCVSSLIFSGKLSDKESEVIESILQEKLKALNNTSSDIQSSILFDFIPDTHQADKAARETTTPQNSFAARLRLALTHSGMTQGVLADWTGVSQGAISSYVTGRVKEAGITRARLMAQALKVSAMWLIYGEGEMYSKQPESIELQAARIKFSGSNP